MTLRRFAAQASKEPLHQRSKGSFHSTGVNRFPRDSERSNPPGSRRRAEVEGADTLFVGERRRSRRLPKRDPRRAMFAPPICRRSRRNASAESSFASRVSSEATKTAGPWRTSQRAIGRSERSERGNPTLCPRWDSNPCWSGFKPPASAIWATGASHPTAGVILARVGFSVTSPPWESRTRRSVGFWFPKAVGRGLRSQCGRR